MKCGEKITLFHLKVFTIHHPKGDGSGISDLSVTLSLKLAEVLHKVEIMIKSLERCQYKNFTTIIYKI